MKAKLEEYNHILKRIDKASEYFSKLSDEEISNVEETKAYKLLGQLIYRANELYMELKEANIDVWRGYLMSIQKIISELSRKIGSLEVIHYGRVNKSIIKSKDLLVGVYMLDDSIELRGVTGTEISLIQDKFFKYKKIKENVYRFNNRSFEVIIRPIKY